MAKSQNIKDNSITIREARKVLDYSIKGNLKRSLMFLGAPGVGKSDFVHQVAAENDMQVKDLRLLLFSETDLKGIPMPDESTGRTKWLPNSILPDAERDGEKGILLIEELTSAPKRVQAAAYQLTLDRRLGDYILPEGWFIVAAGNREDDDGVYVQMPSPLANRFQIHTVYPDLNVWKQDYAYAHDVNPLVIAFLNFHSEALHTQEPGENSMIFATPRSWVAVSDILNAGADIQDDFTRIMVEGNVGDQVASEFIEFAKHQQELDKIDDILEGKDVSAPKQSEVFYILTSTLVGRIASDYKETGKINKKWAENTVNFLASKASPEFTTLGLMDLIALDPPQMKKFFLAEVDSPEFNKFISDNNFMF